MTSRDPASASRRAHARSLGANASNQAAYSVHSAKNFDLKPPSCSVCFDRWKASRQSLLAHVRQALKEASPLLNWSVLIGALPISICSFATANRPLPTGALEVLI